jgi:hypothetical protein
VAIAIRVASRAHVPALARLFGRTFCDDPIITWPLSSLASEEVERATAEWFLPFQATLVEYGLLWEASESIGEEPLGGAAWISPGSERALAEASRVSESAILAHTVDGGTRLDALWGWIDEHEVPEPHWFLDHIAVAPERQGEGIGGGADRDRPLGRALGRYSRRSRDRPGRTRGLLRAPRLSHHGGR